jgi:hypothetical protein
VLGLGPTGLKRRRLGGLGRGGAVALHGGDDLLAPMRKRLAKVGRDADDVGVALRHLLEQQARAVRQLVAQDRLVDEAGGAGVAVEVAPIESGPAPVGALGQIGEQDVGVQRRVAGPAGAMTEGGTDEALGVTDGGSAMTTAHVTGVTFEVLQGGVDGPVVAADDHLGRGLVPESPHQRHRLGCRQREFEPGPGGPGGAQRLVAARATAGEHRSQLVALHRAAEPEAGGAGPDPAARRLAHGEVVVLGPVEDLLQVVRLLAEAQLPDAQHGCRRWSRTLVQVCGRKKGRGTASSPRRRGRR